MDGMRANSVCNDGSAAASGPTGRARRQRRFSCDLEQLRPPLAGDEEAVARGVVGDAVEHVHLLREIGSGEESAQVDRAP